MSKAELTLNIFNYFLSTVPCDRLVSHLWYILIPGAPGIGSGFHLLDFIQRIILSGLFQNIGCGSFLAGAYSNVTLCPIIPEYSTQS